MFFIFLFNAIVEDSVNKTVSLKELDDEAEEVFVVTSNPGIGFSQFYRAC